MANRESACMMQVYDFTVIINIFINIYIYIEKKLTLNFVRSKHALLLISLRINKEYSLLLCSSEVFRREKRPCDFPSSMHGSLWSLCSAQHVRSSTHTCAFD